MNIFFHQLASSSTHAWTKFEKKRLKKSKNSSKHKAHTVSAVTCCYKRELRSSAHFSAWLSFLRRQQEKSSTAQHLQNNIMHRWWLILSIVKNWRWQNSTYHMKRASRSNKAIPDRNIITLQVGMSVAHLCISTPYMMNMGVVSEDLDMTEPLLYELSVKSLGGKCVQLFSSCADRFINLWETKAYIMGFRQQWV